VERWVVFGADGDYLVGAFDGVTFTPSQPLRKADWGKNRYAAQTYAEVPAGDGRRIHIAWMNGGQYPEMPFNQQMSFPGTLHLRRGGDGLCLCRWPVDEIRSLWGAEHVWHDEPLAPGDNPLAELRGELWDLEADIALGAASRIRLMVRGEAITYDVQADELTCLGAVAPLHANGALRLRVLVDRTSLEVFAQDGAVPMTSCWLPPAQDTSLALGVEGGVAHLNRLEARELKSAWNKI
jgi:levanase/fructan beta-fructosidase